MEIKFVDLVIDRNNENDKKFKKIVLKPSNEKLC